MRQAARTATYNAPSWWLTKRGKMPTEKETVRKVGLFLFEQSEVLTKLSIRYGEGSVMGASALLRAQYMIDTAEMVLEHFGIKKSRQPGEDG